jgi:hypothetical protein
LVSVGRRVRQSCGGRREGDGKREIGEDSERERRHAQVGGQITVCSVPFFPRQ